MKSSKFQLLLALVPGFALLSACGSGSGDGSAAVAPPAVPTYPAAADNYEGSSGDNTFATASTIAVGQSQARTIWPAADMDYIKVDLIAGTTYEFSANRVCATCDTYMYLYDTDAATELLNNDDYLYLDSSFQYTPAVDGTYYIMVSAYDPVLGIAAFTLNVHPFTDGDSDTYSSYYDCNDSDATIYPMGPTSNGPYEVAGDGISQDCSGTDQLVETTADPFEDDDSPATAKAMYMSDFGLEEVQFQQAAYAQNHRTIHAAGQVDYFSVTLAPKEAVELDMYRYTLSLTLDMMVYDSDGTTPLGSLSRVRPTYSLLENTTSASKTFYVSYSAADETSLGWYVPELHSVGVDNDGDGYYSRNWDNSRDCNDSDATINPAATETADDSIDSNCDGADNT